MKNFIRFTFLLISLLFLHLQTWAQDELNPCLKSQDFHIVVLGSSTAAGAGPSVPDSAWVNRYRKFLEDINPANQVTNLALGGTNTYQIMPTWFVPPPGKPAANPARNITQAIALNADAVIVNMPSNDAASGFGTNEQMFNFHTIVSSADSAGIPVWICTTQPRVFSASQIQIQLEVRDSVLAAFGNMAIDFWTGLADSTNQPDPFYDSGDGVHLNDAGHNILYNRVKAKNILSQLFIPSTSPDFALLEANITAGSACGDSLTKVSLIVGNVGADTVLAVSISLIAANLDSGSVQTVNDTLVNGLNECATDTFEFVVNTYEGGQFEFSLSIASSDANPFNDSLIIHQRFSGYPELTVSGDVICAGDSAVLNALTLVNDTVLWYATDTGSLILAGGTNYVTPGLNTSYTYYAEAIRGDLFYKNSVYTRDQTNIDFNGYMFDFAAATDLVMDSIRVKFNTPGIQIIELYSKNGTHLGFDSLPAAWTLWHTDTITVDSSGQFVSVSLNGLYASANDTIALYIQLQNSSSNLSYQWVPNPVTRTNNQISVTNGSGISHNFSGSFYPRDLAYELFYHYGFNPTGDCSTGRVPVQALVSIPDPDLGNDTAFCQQYYNITLNPGNFNTYLWSTGDTTATVTIPSMYYQIGFNDFYVFVFDSIGCSAVDSIVINFLLCSSMDEVESNGFNLYPVPANGFIQINYLNPNLRFETFTLLDLKGRMIKHEYLLNNQIDIRGIAPSTYFLRFESDELVGWKQIIIQ